MKQVKATQEFSYKGRDIDVDDHLNLSEETAQQLIAEGKVVALPDEPEDEAPPPLDFGPTSQEAQPDNA